MGQLNLQKIAINGLNQLSPYLNGNKTEVISPLSFSLAVGGLCSASKNVQSLEQSIGIKATQDEVKSLLNLFNFNRDLSYLKSILLYQQIGDYYRFDSHKKQKLLQDYIFALHSPIVGYEKEAEQLINKETDITLNIPKVDYPKQGGIATYGAVHLKDTFDTEAPSIQNEFIVDQQKLEVPSYPLKQTQGYYSQGENYTAFEHQIKETSNLIILPNQGVSLESLSLSEIYLHHLKTRREVYANGYIPYFHVKTEIDLTSTLMKNITGNEIFYDDILCDDVPNDLTISYAFQVSEYTFSPKGSEGQSITGIGLMRAIWIDPKTPISFQVNHPFYSLSLYKDFPLFASKICIPESV